MVEHVTIQQAHDKWSEQARQKPLRQQMEQVNAETVEASGVATEAELEEARQAVRRRRRRKPVARKPVRRAQPTRPPHYEGQALEPVEAISQEMARVQAEIGVLEQEISLKRQYMNLLLAGAKRMQKATAPIPEPAPKREVEPDANGYRKGVDPKPGGHTSKAVATLRRVGHPLYITELARHMGYRTKRQRDGLLATISPDASKRKYGICRTGPSVFGLVEWLPPDPA